MSRKYLTQWGLGILAAAVTIITAVVIPHARSSESRITHLERRTDVGEANYRHIKESLDRIESRLDKIPLTIPAP